MSSVTLDDIIVHADVDNYHTLNNIPNLNNIVLLIVDTINNSNADAVSLHLPLPFEFWNTNHHTALQ